MNEDEELYYTRWKEHVLKTAGKEQEEILRYLWNLYSSLLEEIKELNKQNRTYNFLKNGKNER